MHNLHKNTLSDLNQKLERKNTSELEQLISETAFWLADTLQHRLTVDHFTLAQLQNTQTLSDIKTKISNLETQIKNLKDTDVVTTKSEIQTIEDNIHSLEKDIRGIRSEINTKKQSNKQADTTSENDDIFDKESEKNKEKARLQESKATLTAKEKEIKESETEHTKLKQFYDMYKSLIDTRKKELEELKILAQKFKLDPTTNLSANHKIGEPTTPKIIDLDRDFLSQNNATKVNYALCGKDGIPLIQQNGLRKISTTDGQAIELKGIEIQGNTLKYDKTSITPLNVQYPLHISLTIRGSIQDPTTGIILDHMKPLTLTIEQGGIDQTQREATRDNIANMWQNTNTIQQKMQTLQQRMFATWGEDTFVRTYTDIYGTNPEFNKFTDDEKKEFFNELKKHIKRDIKVQQNLYPEAKLAITSQTPTDPNFYKDETSYAIYLSNNMENLLSDFLKEETKKTLTEQINVMEIQKFLYDFSNKKEFTKQQEAQDDAQRVGQLFNRLDSNNAVLPKTISKLRKNKKNYMWLLSGSSDTQSNSFDIEKVGKVDYKSTLTYNKSNHVQITIDCPQVLKKPLIINGNTHIELIKNILKNHSIPHQNLRTQLAISILKNVISIADKKNIELWKYNQPPHKASIQLHDGSIQLQDERYDQNTNVYTTNTLWNEESDKLSTSPDTIVQLAELTNECLNNAADEFFGKSENAWNLRDIEAKTKRFLLLSEQEKMSIQGRRGSRRLRKRVNKKHPLNKPVSFSIDEDGKQAAINYQPNGTISINVAGQTYKGKNLRKLLNTKGPKSLFNVFKSAPNRPMDGLQLTIMRKLFEELTSSRLQSPRLNQYHYYHTDVKTKITYVLSRVNGAMQLSHITPPAQGPRGNGATQTPLSSTVLSDKEKMQTLQRADIMIPLLNTIQDKAWIF